MGKELTATNGLTVLLRLQQITGGFFPHTSEEDTKFIPIGKSNPKIEYLKKDIPEAGDLKIIIWARFVSEITAINSELQKAMPDKVINTYYGAVDIERRNEIKENFMKGEVDILIINPQTGAMGLNLQTGRLNYYYSNHQSLGMRLQSEDRTHRIGQKYQVIYKDLVMKKTVDETIIESLKNKKEVLSYFQNKNAEEIL